MTTENHGFHTPSKGETDWHIPLNDNMAGLDTLVEIRDTLSNRSNYTPKEGAKFLATDTGDVFFGDGQQWTSLGQGGTQATFDARNYSGAIGGERIQNALADTAEVDNGVVVVTGNGPDDVSGYDTSSRDDAWLIDSALKVPSNTVLRFRGAHLFLDSDVDSNLIRNEAATSGDDRRDTDIHILGDRATYLNGNGRNQSRPLAPDEPQTEPGSFDHFGVFLHKVDWATIRGFQIGQTAGWGVVAQDFTDCVMADIHFRQDGSVWNQDGCSFIGPGTRGHITGITGQFGDDFATVYGNTDWLNSAAGPGGDISNVAISDCLVRPAADTDIMPSVRIQAGDGTSISNVSATNLSLNGGYFKIMNNNGSQRHEDLQSITISNVTSDGAKGGLALGGRMEGLSVSNYDITDSANIFFYANGMTGTGAKSSPRRVHVDSIWIESDAPLFYTGKNGGDLEDILFRGVTYTTAGNGESGAKILFYNGQTSRNLVFEDVTIDGDSSGEGFYASTDHTFSNFRMTNMHLRNVTDGVVIRSNDIESPVKLADVTFDGLSGRRFAISPDGVVIDGVGTERAPAETPTTDKWTVGDIVEFTDTDDGTGDGTYLLSPDGSWSQLTN